MKNREKLVELIISTPNPNVAVLGKRAGKGLMTAGWIADHLIANGVTFANRLEEKQATSDEKTSDWISVEDRLPEPYVEVLTLRYVSDGDWLYQKVDYVTPDYGGKNEWLTDLNSCKSKATHWMPLPAPPEE